MSEVHASIVIHKSLGEVFDYTASPVNGPSFIPNLSKNTNITPQKPGVGQTFNWRFTMVGIDLTGKAEVTEYIPNKKVVLQTTGDSSAIWTYEFSKEGPHATHVAVRVTYDVPRSLFQRVVNSLVLTKINQHSATAMLENLKNILEAQ